jgi:general L-amino acid transport system permease protein
MVFQGRPTVRSMAIQPQPGLGLLGLWTFVIELGRNERVRGIVFQVLMVAGLAAFVFFLFSNTVQNLDDFDHEVGFGFLADQAFFEINQNLIEYSSMSTFGRALLVGLLNTLLVSVLGIISATIVGFIMGVLRLSSNWLVARLAGVYVEGTRNVPLLLQIILWWTVLVALPKVRDSISLGDVFFLSNRGVRMPTPVLESGFGWVVIAVSVGIILALVISKWATRRRISTGQGFPILWLNLLVIFLVPAVLFLMLGRPLSWDIPIPGRFNYSGGMNITPELVALWWALTLYTGAFIAENVRAGILSVSKGQTEAAYALGLRPSLTMRKIVLPQALRVIIPPLTSQYLNLTKNSSLAIVIGYQDLVSVGNTVLNQSGHSIEVVAVWMLVYLSLSLATAAFMNWYNARVSLVE